MSETMEGLDWTFGGRAAGEPLDAWLDRVHPMQYGFDDRGRYFSPDPRKGRVVGPDGRFNRCPTCEEWSPCDVRAGILTLFAAPDVAARLLDRAESYQRDAGVIRQSGDSIADAALAAEVALRDELDDDDAVSAVQVMTELGWRPPWHAEAVAYETVAAELRRVAEEVGR